MATIGFSTKFPWGKKTHFILKIWKGLIDNNICDEEDFCLYYPNILCDDLENGFELSHLNPKIHTIREDKADLWKPGRKINPVVFNRTKDRFQFAPVLECKSVQVINISYVNTVGVYNVKTNTDLRVVVAVDGKVAVYDVWEFDEVLPAFEKVRDKIGMEELAQNDGFNSVQEFFWYFNKDFTGKIIHWIELDY